MAGVAQQRQPWLKCPRAPHVPRRVELRRVLLNLFHHRDPRTTAVGQSLDWSAIHL